MERTEQAFTSPRLRGEVGLRASFARNPGEGDSPQTECGESPPHPNPLPASLSYSHIFLSPINGLRVRESGFFRIRSLDLLFGGRFVGHLESSRVERSVGQVHPSQRCVNPVAASGEREFTVLAAPSVDHGNGHQLVGFTEYSTNLVNQNAPRLIAPGRGTGCWAACRWRRLA